MRKDFASSFAVKGEAAKKRLEDLKDRATDGLELVLDGMLGIPSKWHCLKHVRENVTPLILQQLEGKGIAALLEQGKCKA